MSSNVTESSLPSGTSTYSIWRLIHLDLREAAHVQPGHFVCWMALTIAKALVPAAQVWVVRALSSAMVDHRMANILLLVVAAAGVLMMSVIAGDGWHALGNVIGRRMGAEGNARVAETMASFSPEELMVANTSVQARAARDAATEVVPGFVKCIIHAFSGAVGFVLLLWSLWGINPWTAILLGLAMAASLPFMSRISKIEEESFQRQSATKRKAAYLTDQLVYQTTATELAAMGTGRRVASWVRESYLQSWRIYSKAIVRTIGTNSISALITAALAGLAIYIAAASNPGDPGGAVAAVMAVISGSAAMMGMGMSIGDVAMSKGPMRQYYEFVDSAPDKPIEDVQPLPVEVIRAEDVSYRYQGREDDALSSASLEARRGEMIALVGVNGAGKTTLVNCLAGLYRPTQGRVLLDGADASSLTAGQRNADVALLTQEFGRYELTVRESLCLGTVRDDVTDDELWAALSLAKADHFVRSMPDGLDTQLGQQWGGVGLSGGQWQRLALARIALKKAAIWILDEPTSAIDAQTEEEIFQDLGATRSGRITIIVSHRAWTLRAMDRIYVLSGGEIVENGSYSELIAADSDFVKMFKFQSVERDS